jgi:hypothetical protein
VLYRTCPALPDSISLRVVRLLIGCLDSSVSDCRTGEEQTPGFWALNRFGSQLRTSFQIGDLSDDGTTVTSKG